MKIIGGIASYEDGIKTVAGDQFSPTRKVRVELNFSLDDGDDADKSVTAVLDKAQAFVLGKLNLKAPTAAATATVAPKAAETTAPGPKAPRAPRKPAAGTQTDIEDLTGAAKPAGKTKADLEREQMEALGAGGAKGETIVEKPAAAPAKTEDPDDLSGLMGDAPAPAAKEITDADLNDAVQKKNGEINSSQNPGGPRIRKLVSEFIEDKSKQPILRDIPQAKRAEFLVKLGELKK